MALRRKTYTPDEIMARLKKTLDAGEIIMACGAGTGLSAKCEELGGADLIVGTSAGYYRTRGRSSADAFGPIGNCNKIVHELGYDLLPIVKDTPVIAGIFASDLFSFIDLFIEDLARLGYSGITNSPSYAPHNPDDVLSGYLKATNVTYEREVEMIQMAHEMGLFTMGYAWNGENAAAMAKAGANIVVANLGDTIGGLPQSDCAMPPKYTLDDAVKIVQEVRDAAVAARSDVLVLAHGGPIAEPEDFQYVLDHTHGVVGFCGGSSFERIPVERNFINEIKAYCSCTFSD